MVKKLIQCFIRAKVHRDGSLFTCTLTAKIGLALSITLSRNYRASLFLLPQTIDLSLSIRATVNPIILSYLPIEKGLSSYRVPLLFYISFFNRSTPPSLPLIARISQNVFQVAIVL